MRVKGFLLPELSSFRMIMHHKQTKVVPLNFLKKPVQILTFLFSGLKELLWNFFTLQKAFV